MAKDKQVVVYDLKLMRPACVLLQAAMGGIVSGNIFPSDCWLIDMTPDMKAYAITDEELDKLVAFHSGVLCKT